MPALWGTCTSAGETALHKFAKQVLNDRLEFMLPQRSVEESGEREVVVPAGTYKFDKAILEKKTGAIVPDVVLIKGDRKLIIEFKVTHACGDEKIAEIRRLGSGLIAHNQKMTAAAMRMAEKKVWAHRS